MNQKIKAKLLLYNDLSKSSRNTLDKLLNENRNTILQTKACLEECRTKFPALDKVNADRIALCRIQLEQENKLLGDQLQQRQLLKLNADASFVQNNFKKSATSKDNDLERNLSEKSYS